MKNLFKNSFIKFFKSSQLERIYRSKFSRVEAQTLVETLLAVAVVVVISTTILSSVTDSYTLGYATRRRSNANMLLDELYNKVQTESQKDEDYLIDLNNGIPGGYNQFCFDSNFAFIPTIDCFDQGVMRPEYTIESSKTKYERYINISRLYRADTEITCLEKVLDPTKNCACGGAGIATGSGGGSIQDKCSISTTLIVAWPDIGKHCAALGGGSPNGKSCVSTQVILARKPGSR